MLSRWRLGISALIAVVGPLGSGSAFAGPDGLGAAADHVSGMPDRHGGCRSELVGTALSLADAIELALCNNPRTQKSWASAVAAVDDLRINQAAYLPSLTANGSAGPSRIVTDTSAKGFDSDVKSDSRSAGVNLGLTLLDFGKRRADVERARHLLSAANASQSATLVNVFLQTAQAYYDLVGADAVLRASQRAEDISNRSVEVAEGRHRGGTAALTDQLQAETAHLQDKARRINAQSAAASARGSLAIAMGFDADAAFTLKADLGDLPAMGTLEPPAKLMAEAKANNPEIAEARARYLAASDQIRLAIARRFPTVTLQAAYDAADYTLSRSNTFGITDVPTDNTHSNASVQLRITLPLFDGTAGHAIHQARAEAEASRADLVAAEQQITLDVWKAYQQVTVQGENIPVTQEILRAATDSLHASETRYRLGSGNIIEVLNAQTSLASAERQRIDVLSSWRTARLRLLAALGQLGMWAIE
jgi:outer membrane protein